MKVKGWRGVGPLFHSQFLTFLMAINAEPLLFLCFEALAFFGQRQIRPATMINIGIIDDGATQSTGTLFPGFHL